MSVTVEHGDCIDAMARMAGEGVAVDSVVTDPPYGLQFMGRKWDKLWRDKTDADQAYVEKTAGELTSRARKLPDYKATNPRQAQAWHEQWARRCFDLLKPGGHMLVFGIPRAHHRMICAVEDAGFEIRDCLLWLFGSGFPKSHNLKDRQGWGTALKPAAEFICMARKPLIGTVAENVQAHGTGAINVDGCRVGVTDDEPNRRSTPSVAMPGMFGATGHDGTLKTGRWPANVCHDGSEEVVEAFAAQSDGMHSAGHARPNAPGGGYAGGTGWGGIGVNQKGFRIGDTGTAARFFFSANFKPPCGLCGLPLEARDDIKESWLNASIASETSSRAGTENEAPSDSVPSDAPGYTPPASKATKPRKSAPANGVGGNSSPCHPLNESIVQENAQRQEVERIARNVRSAAHLCGLCEIAIAHALVEARYHRNAALPLTQVSISEPKRQILIQSLARYVEGRENTDTILTTASLKTLFGSVFHAIGESTSSANPGSAGNISPGRTRFRYTSKAGSDDRWGSKHPTVKPIDLMRWLCRLVTPPKGLVLDPFAGSGTTGIACLAEGFDAILIEREDEYVADIEARLAWYRGEGRHSLVEKARNKVADDHGPLFAETPA